MVRSCRNGLAVRLEGALLETLGNAKMVGGERSYNLARKLSLCYFDVYISTTYNVREKGEKSR